LSSVRTAAADSAIFTSRNNQRDYTCPAATSIAQPYNGQFVYLTVDSVQAL
jgi:hypothetical protein